VFFLFLFIFFSSPWGFSSPYRRWQRERGTMEAVESGEVGEATTKRGICKKAIWRSGGERGYRTGSAPPRPPPAPGPSLRAACCAAPRAGRASGQRRLPPRQSTSQSTRPNPHVPIHSPGVRPVQPGGGGGAGLLLGSALLFSDGAFPHFEPRRRAQGPGCRIAAPAEGKITRKYRCVCFALFAARFPLSSLRAVLYTRGLVPLRLPETARAQALHTSGSVSTYKIK